MASQFASMFRRWPFAIAVILLALGGYVGWHHFHGKPSSATASQAATPVPVTVAPVEKADFPVYLTGS